MPQHWKGFARLLERYQKGNATKNEKQFMDIWYDSLSQEDEGHQISTDPNVGVEMWSAVQKGMSAHGKSGSIRRFYWGKSVYFRLLAASVVFVVGVFAYRVMTDEKSVIAGVNNGVIDQMVRTANDGNMAMVVSLSDGSRVTLDPGAVLYYPAMFEQNQRNVFLTGNGLFDIAPNKEKPFFVHANNIVTKVVGTSFTIRENKDRNSIEVAVLSGVVEVAKALGRVAVNENENKVVLTPNKKATFYKEGERLITGLVEQPRLIAPIKNDPDFATFVFKERAFSQILPKLEKAYGVRISLSDEDIQHCLVTADVSQDKTLFAQLDILCAAIGADFEVQNDMVLITGTGCEITSKSDNP